MRQLAAALIGLCSLSFAASAADAPVTVTTGAGYIPVVKKIVNVCKAQHNAPAAESYGGNIGQMLAQIASGSGVNLVITDKATIDRIKTDVRFSVRQSLGTTPLVLIWKKGLTLTKPEDVKGNTVKTLALPDSKAAVYGRAGSQWVKSQKDPALEAKLMQVSGVPQVASYVARGEVDAGFVNVSTAKQNLKKLGGMLEVTGGYQTIELQALVVKGNEGNPNVQKFLTCLTTPEVAKVLTGAGVVPAKH